MLLMLTQAGDLPVVGDWNGDGRTKVGLFRQGFFWILDYNGNGLWDGPGVDRVISLGQGGDTPVIGDWNGDGQTSCGTDQRLPNTRRELAYVRVETFLLHQVKSLNKTQDCAKEAQQWRQLRNRSQQIEFLFQARHFRQACLFEGFADAIAPIFPV